MKKQQCAEMTQPFSASTTPGKAEEELGAPTSPQGRQAVHLIAALQAPLDPEQLRNAFHPKAEGIALLDATGLRADTARYAEERFFALYRDAAKAAQGNCLFLLSPDVSPKLHDSICGLRYLLAYPQLFFSQLCAALRASALGRVCLVLPLVSTVWEIEQARRLIEGAMRLLLSRGEIFDDTVQLGIVIGTPAAAMLSHELIEEVDFLVVDTDALTRLSIAADPDSPLFSELFAESANAILHLIGICVENAHRLGRFSVIRGEMASNSRFLSRFLAMGADALSVPPRQLARMRDLVRAQV